MINYWDRIINMDDMSPSKDLLQCETYIMRIIQNLNASISHNLQQQNLHDASASHFDKMARLGKFALLMHSNGMN